jgi:hypothetical protein
MDAKQKRMSQFAAAQITNCSRLLHWRECERDGRVREFADQSQRPCVTVPARMTMLSEKMGASCDTGPNFPTRNPFQSRSFVSLIP